MVSPFRTPSYFLSNSSVIRSRYYLRWSTPVLLKTLFPSSWPKNSSYHWKYCTTPYHWRSFTTAQSHSTEHSEGGVTPLRWLVTLASPERSSISATLYGDRTWRVMSTASSASGCPRPRLQHGHGRTWGVLYHRPDRCWWYDQDCNICGLLF